MKSIDFLEKQINKIGEDMIHCPLQCPSIVNKGIRMPRCLYLEKGSNKRLACVVIGLNPGKRDKEGAEYKYYKNRMDRGKNRSYKILTEYFPEVRSNVRYYRNTVTFLEKFKLATSGDTILWTELCKCELGKGEKLDQQTLRKCAGRYLARELQLIDDEVLLIALGRETFNALRYMCPNHPIIGIPHPSGSYGQFYSLLESNEVKLRVLIDNAVEEKSCIWLKVYKD